MDVWPLMFTSQGRGSQVTVMYVCNIWSLASKERATLGERG